MSKATALKTKSSTPIKRFTDPMQRYSQQVSHWFCRMKFILVVTVFDTVVDNILIYHRFKQFTDDTKEIICLYLNAEDWSPAFFNASQTDKVLQADWKHFSFHNDWKTLWGEKHVSITHQLLWPSGSKPGSHSRIRVNECTVVNRTIS